MSGLISRVHTLMLSLIEVAEVCWLRWRWLHARQLDNAAPELRRPSLDEPANDPNRNASSWPF
jgi:hypothetical protein